MVAAIYEAQMTHEQAEQLAGMVHDGREDRPEGVVAKALTVEDGLACLTAYWANHDALDRYLSVSVPGGIRLMRTLGVEARVRIVEVLELG